MNFDSIIGFLSGIWNFKLFALNQTNISIGSLIMFMVILLSFSVISRVLKRSILSRVMAKVELEASVIYAINRVIHYLIMVVAVIVAFQFIGVDLSGLAVIFGLVSVGIGFGLQNITADFISGLLILFEQPIKVGDRVSVGKRIGDIEEINIRSTTIRSLDNISIIVPNHEFVNDAVTNWSYVDDVIRIVIKFRLAFNADLGKVKEILKQITQEMPEILQEPPPQLFIWEFGEWSINMEYDVYIHNPRKFRFVKSQINFLLIEKFRQNDISFARPHQVIQVADNELGRDDAKGDSN